MQLENTKLLQMMNDAEHRSRREYQAQTNIQSEEKVQKPKNPNCSVRHTI